jgi:hypothetical protein
MVLIQIIPVCLDNMWYLSTMSGPTTKFSMLMEAVRTLMTVPDDIVRNLSSQTILGGTIYSFIYIGPQVNIAVLHYKGSGIHLHPDTVNPNLYLRFRAPAEFALLFVR